MYLSFYGQTRLGVSVSTPDLQMFDRSPANLAEFRKNQHQHQHFMKKTQFLMKTALYYRIHYSEIWKR